MVRVRLRLPGVDESARRVDLEVLADDRPSDAGRCPASRGGSRRRRDVGGRLGHRPGRASAATSAGGAADRSRAANTTRAGRRGPARGRPDPVAPALPFVLEHRLDRVQAATPSTPLLVEARRRQPRARLDEPQAVRAALDRARDEALRPRGRGRASSPPPSRAPDRARRRRSTGPARQGLDEPAAGRVGKAHPKRRSRRRLTAAPLGLLSGRRARPQCAAARGALPGESDEYRPRPRTSCSGGDRPAPTVEAVAARRRDAPLGGEVPTDYVFEGWDERPASARQVRLSELFEDGKDTLFLYSFMFDPGPTGPLEVRARVARRSSTRSTARLRTSRSGSTSRCRQGADRAIPCARADARVAPRATALLGGSTYNADYRAEDPDGPVPDGDGLRPPDGEIHHTGAASLARAARGGPAPAARRLPLAALGDPRPDARGRGATSIHSWSYDPS